MEKQMDIYVDCEFREYHKQHTFLGFKIGKPCPTIELISIGMIRADGLKYYAINKECELKQIWKDKWLRDNVLYKIYRDYYQGDITNHISFSYQVVKGIFDRYGKSEKQIAQEIVDFSTILNSGQAQPIEPRFIGYYFDYDWVVICKLFGRMIDLPKGFPMYGYDLKQLLDDSVRKSMDTLNQKNYDDFGVVVGFDTLLKRYKKKSDYPVNQKEHHALGDAIWEKHLHEWIIKNFE